MSQVRDFAPASRVRGVVGTVVLLAVLVVLGLHIGWVLFPAGHGAGTSTAPTELGVPGVCEPLPTVPIPAPPVPTTRPVIAR